MKATSLLLLALCFVSSGARSQRPFDGTWMIDTGKNENLASEKPKVLSVADGVFREGDRQIKADGSDQRVPATGYWDTVSVRIVDDRTVEVISKKAGKPESWTHKWTHVKPGWHPVFVRLALHFGGGSVANPLRTGLFSALTTGPSSPVQLPQVSEMRCSADSYLDELKAEAARVRGASPWRF